MKIKDAELKSILAEVEGEIASLIKSEKAKLAKNASEQSPGGESSPAESSPAGESAGGPPAEGSESAGAPAMSAAPAPSPSAAPAAAPAAPEAAPADPAAAGMDAGAPPSLEELAAEYSKLPPEELKMHYLAAKTALFQTMGSADAGAGMDPAAGAAPSPAPALPSASPAGDVPPAPPAMKGEMPYGSKTVGNDESASDSDPKPSGTGDTKSIVTKGSMPYGSKKPGDDSKASDSNPKPTGTGQTKPVITEKSELESELESLRKGQSEITKVLEALIGTPERKAFTGTEIQYIKKSEIESKPVSKKLRKSVEEMTTTDVNARLNEITRSPSLKKSDRERINKFYANMLDLNEIKDLLTDEV